MGETLEAYLALEPARRERVRSTLNELGSNASERAVRRAVAFLLAEYRGPTMNWETLAEAIDQFGELAEYGLTEPTLPKNVTNFVTRSVEGPSGDMFALYALFAMECLEGVRGKSLKECCFAEQWRVLQWIRNLARTGDAGPIPRVDPDHAGGDPRLQGLTLEGVRHFVDSRLTDALPDDALRKRLGWTGDTHQVGYLCFRSALKTPFDVVQSFLTLLAPERSGIPFWTFAHVYELVGEHQLRAAGGLVLTTRHAMYLVGGEGWIDPEHAQEPGIIFKSVRPTTLTMSAIPIDELGRKSPLWRGLTLTANGKDTPIVSRMAIRRLKAGQGRSHQGLLDLVSVDQFKTNIRELATEGRIEVAGWSSAGGDATGGRRRPDPITRDTNEILTAINNRPEAQFLAAHMKDDPERVLSHDQIVAQIEKIFTTDGAPNFKAHDGTDYRYLVHQWFHALKSQE